MISKVVQIFTSNRHLHNFQEVNAYNLKNNSWRIIDCPRDGAQLISLGKFVNGKLHWATIVGLAMKRCWSITSFNWTDEKWRKVMRPYYGEEDGVLVLGALESHLSMICNNPTTHIDVWAMKEYGDKESWMKTFTINYTADPADYYLS
ncbi:hypothetical protein HAX54_052434 [Datura stramonium]|uniref:F-box associated beta-propeller type 1 domain-containing protein n=1 Tax=Datura stramonium TaxID=4076 RepID=A0ABS8RRN4_DATST|nr:hypothetical protein [Datura stramonium]